MRVSHTYVTMEVSPTAFKEIEAKLREADYQHAISMDGDKVEGLTMQGIMLTCGPEPTPERVLVPVTTEALSEERTSVAKTAEGFGIPADMLAPSSNALARPGSFHENLAREMREGRANFVSPSPDEIAAKERANNADTDGYIAGFSD